MGGRRTRVKLLLVSVNRERFPYPVFPLGLSFLATPLAAAGHELTVLDLCFEEQPLASLSGMIDRVAPDAVLVSLRNLDNVTWPSAISYLPELKEVVELCSGRARVILGGSGFSLMPREILDASGADIGIVGEGEEILPRLLVCLEGGGDPSSIPGVIVKGFDGFQKASPVARVITPDRRLFNVARYLSEGGMANVQTKRGCPFGCIYCTYPLLEGKGVRLRPVADIISEIRGLVEQHQVDYIYFVDDIFNYPESFAESLCNAIVSEGLGISWSAFINPEFISASLLETMKLAGCDAVEFGTDSGSPEMLRSLGKSFDAEQIRNASMLCRSAGIDFAHYILFGGPGESVETISESFRLMDELSPTAVIAMTGVRIYPGTALERIALDEGVISPGCDLLEPVFYISPQIADSIEEIVTKEAMQRKNWIVPGLEVNVSPAMLEAIRMFKIRGPLWKLMKKLGRSHQHPLAS